MPIAERLGPLAVAAALAAAGLAAACSAPRTPNTADDADAGDLTCDERVRARDLCLQAMNDRCRSQQNECESGCDARGNLPANTQKTPSSRDDMESGRCREQCRQSHDGCVHSIQARCPAACDSAAPAPVPAAAPTSDAGAL